MIIFRQANTRVDTRATDHPSLLALRMLGTGYDQAFQASARWFLDVYVAIDKFSKWIEYKPLVSATAKKAVELFEDVIHKFGLPNSIITDLGTTFIGHHF